MELWIDTLNEELIQLGEAQGWLHGVTTNPSLVSASSKSLDDILRALLALQRGPVAVQVTGDNAETMVEQALRLRQASQRIICKVPTTREGYRAIKVLAEKQVPTMATALVEVRQALLAAQAGATYVAPYVGAIEKEMHVDPFPVLESIQRVFRNYNYSTKILAASFLHVADLMRFAEIGLQAATLKECVIEELVADAPTTLSRVERFAVEWTKAQPTSLL